MKGETKKAIEKFKGDLLQSGDDIQNSAKLLGNALEQSWEGFKKSCQDFGRPQIIFTRWERWKLKFYYYWGMIKSTQSLILKKIEKGK